MNLKMCKYLYHYTTVDTLELILKHKTIRFNPLTKMDDNLEQWSAHGKQEGSHVFISSWTESEEEIPDMWKQYCRPNPDRGVRIRMLKNPFSVEKNHLPYGIKEATEEWIAVTNNFIEQTLHKKVRSYDDYKKLFPVALVRNKEAKKRLIKIHEQISHTKIACLTRDLNNLLIKVEYTNDRHKIFPTMYYDYMGAHLERYDQYGIYKDLRWSWQREWRYRLHFRMLTPGIQHNDGTIDLYDLPFDYYDLILDEEKIKDMQIVLSPTISEDAHMKARKIINSYNPTAVICNSQLKGRF